MKTPLFLENLLCKHFFETNFKVYGFCNRCESPGEDVQQIQRWNCMEVSKYRIDPYNTKYTGSMITINVGAMLLQIPLEDAIAQSIKALNA